MAQRSRMVLIGWASVAIVLLAGGVWWGAASESPRPLATGAGRQESAGGEEAPTTRSLLEARGLWVVRDAMATPESIDRAIETAVHLNANVLFVQVSGRAEAHFRSALLPPGPQAPDFDPLAYTVEQARAAGLEVHAWINAYTAGPFGFRPDSPEHVLARHPDWVTVDREGRSLWEYAAKEATLDLPGIMLEPGLPDVQDHVFSVFMEVVRNYAVDGVHFDYIRYPSRGFGYHPHNRQQFAALYGYDPLELETHPREFRARHGREEYDRVRELWDTWRQDQVTALVRRVYRAVQAEAPWVKVSAAVYADIPDATRERLQNWPGWLEEGILDLAVPMAYSPTTMIAGYQVQQAVAAGAGRHVYAGLGAYLLTDDPLSLLEKVERARAAGAHGIVLFSYNSMVDAPDLIEALRANAFAQPATVPPMPWKAPRPPQAR